jgi:hypothetical protein
MTASLAFLFTEPGRRHDPRCDRMSKSAVRLSQADLQIISVSMPEEMLGISWRWQEASCFQPFGAFAAEVEGHELTLRRISTYPDEAE